MKNLILILFSFPMFVNVLFMQGCQKDTLPQNISTVEGAYKTIIGEWEWEKTTIARRGQEPTIQNSLSENKTRKLVLSENKTLSIIENGNIIARYNYNIVTSAQVTGTGFDEKELLLKLVPLNNNDPTGISSISFLKNILILSNRLGTTDYYIRNHF